MHKGFNLELDDDKPISKYRSLGQSIYGQQKARVQNDLTNHLLFDGSIDASTVQQAWFPKIPAHIFLSHAHADEDIAISLAGFFSQFGLTTFIDSYVWGYADELLKILDNQYCQTNTAHTYDYRARNYSTSHVHMMLATALTTMIDNTECVMFLNTPKSITAHEVIGDRTESPWLYHELAMTRMIRLRPILRDATEDELEKSAKSLPSMKYTVTLNHLCPLNVKNLHDWYNAWTRSQNRNGLDLLYDVV